MSFDDADMLSMYRRMILIRRFEETAVGLRTGGEIYGPVHPYIGQEAIAVGVCSHLSAQDRIASTHRGHGHCLAKGADPARMFAELYGRRDGYCGGKGGSMHIADLSIGMLGANGIVGASLSIAAGAALAAQFEGAGSVAVAFFGDGAVGTGAFHEAMNLSSLWNLPVVWVCENNGWAVRTPLSENVAAEQVTTLASAHGIPSVQVDGNDVEDVAAAASVAVSRARAGHGPSFVEAVTYRMTVHAYLDKTVPDPRDPVEREAWRQRDPIDLYREVLTARSVLDGTADAELRSTIEAEIADAVEYARRSPLPSLSSALDDVFSAEEGVLA